MNSAPELPLRIKQDQEDMELNNQTEPAWLTLDARGGVSLLPEVSRPTDVVKGRSPMVDRPISLS